MEVIGLPSGGGLPSARFVPLRYCPDGQGHWSGHIPFACDIIASLRPAVIVELGSYYGESYFAFCQAAAELGVRAAAFAVDTWEGDTHTGRYATAVFAGVNDYNRERYSAFSELLRARFDEAVARFSDGQIDLLHIDGLHTYEAVRHDFWTWFPKVRPGGVILLHDIAVRRDDFGVWRLWEELRQQYPSFEFLHSCGLGVLLKPGDAPAHGIGAHLFGGTGVDAEGIRSYYELCADRLYHRFRRSSPGDTEEWAFNIQAFWRFPEQEFTEQNSVRLHVVAGSAGQTVRLEIPSATEPAAELRLDIADRRALLEIGSLRLLDTDEAELWRWEPSHEPCELKSSGMQILPEGSAAVLNILATGGAMLLPLPEDVLRRLASGGTVELRLRGLSLDERLEALFAAAREIYLLLLTRPKFLRICDKAIDCVRAIAASFGGDKSRPGPSVGVLR